MVCCYFFFFKQKTAYEMRISDWSSDVCSSDLPDGQRCRDGGGGDRLAHGGLPLVAPPPIGGDESTMQAPPGRALGATGEPPQRPDVLKIGRASCRERVCQYV